ncbi:unnamed protein product [Amaranthus hypochondriacus]
MTNLFSGSDYPTANLYFEQVCKAKYHLRLACESEDTCIREMGNEMFEKLEKYWGESSLILSIAAMFDPRHKIPFLKHHFRKVYQSEDEVYQQIERVRTGLVNLFNDYKSKLILLTKAHQASASEDLASISSRSRDFDGYESFESSQDARFSSNSISEVEKYLESPLHMHSDSKFDILLYWKDQQATYPIMSKIAKDILVIPITTVASESTFSMGGRILNRWRASLLSRHVEALILTRNWLFGYEEEPDEVGLNVGNDLVPDAESHAKGDQGPSGSSSLESD